jgi:hypothetical protein
MTVLGEMAQIIKRCKYLPTIRSVYLNTYAGFWTSVQIGRSPNGTNGLFNFVPLWFFNITSRMQNAKRMDEFVQLIIASEPYCDELEPALIAADDWYRADRDRPMELIKFWQLWLATRRLQEHRARWSP